MRGQGYTFPLKVASFSCPWSAACSGFSPVRTFKMMVRLPGLMFVYVCFTRLYSSRWLPCCVSSTAVIFRRCSTHSKTFVFAFFWFAQRRFCRLSKPSFRSLFVLTDPPPSPSSPFVSPLLTDVVPSLWKRMCLVTLFCNAGLV